MIYENKSGKKVKLITYAAMNDKTNKMMAVYESKKSGKKWVMEKKKFLNDFHLVKNGGFNNGEGI